MKIDPLDLLIFFGIPLALFGLGILIGGVTLGC
jgi:hypothetical protein